MNNDAELSALLDPADAIYDPLPLPGAGNTSLRFRALWSFAAGSPSLGRVAEAHHDAIAILREAGRTDHSRHLHAVWAAGGPDPLQLQRLGNRWHLRGSKHWCSAATLARRALVTAHTSNGTEALVLVDLSHDGVRPQPPDWQSPAMTSVDTRTVHFDIDIDTGHIIGVDDWYLTRPGFWHGAVGVAACWAGCVDGIVDRLATSWKSDPHACAHLGAIDAAMWNLHAIINAAANDIDTTPIGTAEARQQRALRVRHLVDTTVGEVLARIQRALGPGPLAHTRDLHRHITETDLYRRQSHAERDLETLGELAMQAQLRTTGATGRPGGDDHDEASETSPELCRSDQSRRDFVADRHRVV